ncbi:hypothetical protein ACHAXA_005416 [Cyclostephanos tholiformis]|uniref:Uncharacterized protein n=1 Tax=Cyclostephanos tholiformis TaxID=382380 RepID=A0ABD3R8G7_9STRA
MITGVDVGLYKDDRRPLRPHQYASPIVIVKFYAEVAEENGGNGVGGGTGRRNLQQVGGSFGVDSLECRRYEKMKAEGIFVVDIWGCEEQGPSEDIVNLEELSMTEADLIASFFREFLDSRIDRVWTIEVVSLAYQEIRAIDGNGAGGGGAARRLIDSSSPPSRIPDERALANREVAELLLGFRVRAEYSYDQGGMDLSENIIDAVRGGADFFLSELKKRVPTYAHISFAGAVDVRAILQPPNAGFPIANATGIGSNDTQNNVEAPPPETSISQIGTAIGVSFVVLLVSIVAIVVGLFIFRRRKNESKDGINSRKATMAIANREYSSDNDDDGDDLSSRFFSDSSKFDHKARLMELQAYERSRHYPVGRDKNGNSFNGRKSGADPISKRGASRKTRIPSGTHSRESYNYPGSVTEKYASQSSSSIRGDSVGESYLSNGASRKLRPSTGSSGRFGRFGRESLNSHGSTAESYGTHSRSSAHIGGHYRYTSEATRSNPSLGSGEYRKSRISTGSRASYSPKSAAESYRTQSRGSVESRGVNTHGDEFDAMRSNPSLGSGVSRKSRRSSVEIRMPSDATSRQFASSAGSSRRSMMSSGSAFREAEENSEIRGVNAYGDESEGTRSGHCLGNGISHSSKNSMPSDATSRQFASSAGSSRRSMMYSGSAYREPELNSESSSHRGRIITKIT